MDTDENSILERVRLTIRQVAREAVAMDPAAALREPTERDLQTIERGLGSHALPRDVLRGFLRSALQEEASRDAASLERLWEAADYDPRTLILGLHHAGRLPLREDFARQFLEHPRASVRMFKSGPFESLIMGIKRSKVLVDRIRYLDACASRLLQITDLRWHRVTRAYRWPKALSTVMSREEISWFASGMRQAAVRFTRRASDTPESAREEE